jgi:hypothetical protein
VHLYEVWNKLEPGQGFDAKATEWRKAQGAGAAPGVPGAK